ncbi:MAG: TonB-dependent receptor [Saprospiraceae bacterium]|nr:TonB-dependent receptor [Saprospiraceae bacterium]
MKIIRLCLVLALPCLLQAQSSSIKGQLNDASGSPIVFANVALFNAADSLLQKVETTDESGNFTLRNLKAGSYYLNATYVGLKDFQKSGIALAEGQALELGSLTMGSSALELATATVTTSRALVEVKPDRTVFNVEGTINSTGSDALSLLRKAPSVTVDNNDNVSLLGRAGVLLYVDGKRLPLTGQDLSNYLQNLPADQIERFDIITSPGAKYEAEGNAGIIDIRLKRDKNLGANGSLSGNASQGKRLRRNLSGTANFRNKYMNVFGSGGLGAGEGINSMQFNSTQNGLSLGETNENRPDWQYYNLRLGTDFFLGKKHTVGFLVNANNSDNNNATVNRITIKQLASSTTAFDSILVAKTDNQGSGKQNTFNVNYRFDNAKGRTLNIDLDYGAYRNRSERRQNNQYFDNDENDVLSGFITSFDTPTDIDIYTGKLDYEQDLLGGKLGLGTKFSRVASDNNFLVYDEETGAPIRNDRRSNRFDYDEDVYAGYMSYNRPLSKKLNFSGGLRAEKTDATGNLQAFIDSLMEPTVKLNYLSWFPSAGLTWQVAEQHSLNLNYGRRINRPDYNVLNPFYNQLSQLSFEKGNPRLRPEIVNNMELGYTWKYMYNFTVGYSLTEDQITRLIGPDDSDPRASFINWDNLATQKVWSFSVSAPVQITKKWNAYFNGNFSHTNNQADYGNGKVVDVQAFSYSIYQQHTFDLPKGIKLELSGWYSGPGVWGGVFVYDPSYSIDFGIQKKFLQDKLNVRLSANDIFYQSWWSGVSKFNGMVSEGSGKWDSRRIGASISYRFGNDNVKSRQRQTGMEEEGKRVGSGNN